MVAQLNTLLQALDLDIVPESQSIFQRPCMARFGLNRPLGDPLGDRGLLEDDLLED